MQFQLGVIASSQTALDNFLGQQSLSLINVQNSLGGQCCEEMRISREEGRASFPRLCNVVSMKGESGLRLARLADGQLKENTKMNAW